MTQQLKLADYLFASVLDGTKTVTIREGHRPITLGPLVFVSPTNPTDTTAHVYVQHVRHITIAELSQRECLADGVNNPEEMVTLMETFYPGIAIDSKITVVGFYY